MTNNDYKFYLNKGIDLTNQGKFNEAIDSLDKSLELNANNALTHFSKGIAYHNLNQLRAAYENYSKAISFDKKMIDAYFNRAQTVLAFDDATEDEMKEALRDLEYAVELDKNFIDAHYYAAVVKKKLKDYEGAINSLDNVLALDSNAVHSKALKKLILQKYLNK